MNTIYPRSQRPKPAFLQVLFAAATFVLLLYWLLGKAGLLLHRFAGGMLVSPVSSLLVSVVCVGCAVWLSFLRGPAENGSESRSGASAKHAVVWLLLFFGMECAIGAAASWLQWGWLAGRPQWIQILSGAVVCVIARVVGAPLHSWRRGAAVGRRHDRFLASAENSLDDFYIFDGVRDATGSIADFRFSYINPMAERRLGVSRESLVGKILTEVRPFMISSGLIGRYREVVRTGEPFTCEVLIDDEMIQDTWLNVQVVKLGDGIAITSRDVTEHRRLADHVYHLAHYDQLTGLPNRTLLQDRLRHAMLSANRRQQKVAVFMVDVDHFKKINDSLGHAGGDALLAAIGQRLLSSVRKTDTIARIGGDEFVIVMPEFEDLEDVWRCGEQILRQSAEPIRIGNREIQITLSAGLCIYPDCGLTADQLLENADAAMYAVKGSTRNGLQMFESMLESEEGRLV